MKYLLPLLLLLTGCNDASTAEEALKHFLHAVRTQSVSEMTDYTAWHAYTDYANPKGLSRLKKMNLNSFNVIGLSGQKVINWNRRVDYYTAEVLSNGVTALWVRVGCLNEQIDGNEIRVCYLDVIEESPR